MNAVIRINHTYKNWTMHFRSWLFENRLLKLIISP